jgi:hypothetical protein
VDCHECISLWRRCVLRATQPVRLPIAIFGSSDPVDLSALSSSNQHSISVSIGLGWGPKRTWRGGSGMHCVDGIAGSW